MAEAVNALRRVDYRDKPTCYIQEADRGKSYQASGQIKRRMLGAPNVSSTVDELSIKYDL